ncbi:MAG TPA: DUF4240 domain-containing protein [Nocardioides sp.]|uniref:DUF4240 domain-containing protein n=1 Tax=Nocardioides sp. TaxID=35761 RepID=UPI002C08C4AA|nr:DUF4240 domain-containing protein [Nocardioides sp.]HTW14796.1 DUF4240 domain-containing protein [Nocardioides sp.]
MDEVEFWDLIALAEGSADETAVHRIWLGLRVREPDEILGFEDRLAEVLHRLDLRVIAKQRWRDVSEPSWLPRIPGISEDGFLYARCSAVLQGPGMVARILAEPRAFKRRWDVRAEELLYVGPQAYEAVTGRAWDYRYETPVSYETGSNPAGGWS